MTERTGTVCQETPLLKLEDALEQIMRRVFEEIMPFVKANEPEVPAEDLPELSRTRDLQKADFTVQWSKFCAKRKLIAQKYVEDLVLMIQKEIERDDAGGNDSKFSLIQRVEAVGPYMNIFVKRAKVFKLAINAIIEQGEKYGETNAGKGKKVIIEHTSSNPNAPLHIGNLRNVMIGAHLARVMKACGCEVTEAFYVNDLGAQIGLTALAYSRIYTKIKPTMKIDQWIGAMYAVMNTCQELQQVGVQPGDLEVCIFFLF
jgi:arginyl-tRNA synthetase